MEQTNAAKNRSPWPACADCQVEEPSIDSAPAAVPRPEGAPSEEDEEALFGSIEPSTALGPLRDKVRQEVREALHRALARAREAQQREAAEPPRT